MSGVYLAAREYLVTCWDEAGEVVINTAYSATNAVDALAQYQVDQLDEYKGDIADVRSARRSRITRIEIKPVSP